MLQNAESETDILLGTKQLVGIFFLVAILLGVAFTGGYMVGRGPKARAASAAPQAAEVNSDTATTKSDTQHSGQTHTVSADENSASTEQSAPESSASVEPPKPILGERKSKSTHAPKNPESDVVAERVDTGFDRSSATDAYTPPPGTRFIQVAAVGRDEAEAVADVLHKKGFHAHAAPKPGNPKIYRVIVGPVRDAGDLSATRDALRKTGFREVIVQAY